MDTKEKKKGKFARKSRPADMIRRAQRHTKERQEQEARKAKAPAVITSARSISSCAPIPWAILVRPTSLV